MTNGLRRCDFCLFDLLNRMYCSNCITTRKQEQPVTVMYVFKVTANIFFLLRTKFIMGSCGMECNVCRLVDQV